MHKTLYCSGRLTQSIGLLRGQFFHTAPRVFNTCFQTFERGKRDELFENAQFSKIQVQQEHAKVGVYNFPIGLKLFVKAFCNWLHKLICKSATASWFRFKAAMSRAIFCLNEVLHSKCKMRQYKCLMILASIAFIGCHFVIRQLYQHFIVRSSVWLFLQK